MSETSTERLSISRMRQGAYRKLFPYRSDFLTQEDAENYLMGEGFRRSRNNVYRKGDIAAFIYPLRRNAEAPISKPGPKGKRSDSVARVHVSFNFDRRRVRIFNRTFVDKLPFQIGTEV